MHANLKSHRLSRRNSRLVPFGTASLMSLLAFTVTVPLFAAPHRQDNPGSQAENTKKEKSRKDKKAEEETPAAYTGPKKRLAIMNRDQDGSNGANNTAPNSEWFKMLKQHYGFKDADDVGLKLNSMLTTALQKTGRFVLVERQNFDDIRSEQALKDEGQTTAQTGAKKGGVLGAQVMVRCTITEFVDDSVKEGGAAGTHIGPFNLGGGASRKKAKVTVDIKMYEVATSKILYTDTASGNSENKAKVGGVSAFGVTAVFGKSTNDPIEKATRDAITNAVNLIVAKMEDISWEGRVASAEKNDDGKVEYVINRGANDGLKMGDVLQICRAGKDIVDPDTGERIGRSKDKVLGECRVVYLDKNIANVEPASEITIQKGDVVKLLSGK